MFDKVISEKMVVILTKSTSYRTIHPTFFIICCELTDKKVYFRSYQKFNGWNVQ